MPGEFPFIDSRYHLWWPPREGLDSVRMFANAETSPSALLVPTLAPPPVPPGGRRLADFETGTWQIFVAEGEAFGKGPAPAPPGMYGRFAADSTRLGPAAQGALRFAPLTVDQSHLRFVLSGPADPALRVALLDDGKVVRAASGTVSMASGSFVDPAVCAPSASLVPRTIPNLPPPRAAHGPFVLLATRFEVPWVARRPCARCLHSIPQPARW